MKSDFLLSYDVNTEDKAGRKRLRKVAKSCVDYGQRVQYSVFELRLTETQLEVLRQKLLGIIDEEKDSLRIYSLPGGRAKCVEVHGKDVYEDPEEPLLV